MELATGLVSSVFGLYKDVNPSTLSGVNDIIVVEGSDGVLRCSPFHVRFGKTQMFRITSRIVHLHVNGVLTDIVMVIGKQGELYFEVAEAQGREGGHVDFEIDYAEAEEGAGAEAQGCLSDQETLPDPGSVKKAALRARALFFGGVGGQGRYTRRFVEGVRGLNLEKRRFFRKRHRDTGDPYRRLAALHGSFEKLVTSPEYFDFVLASCPELLHVLRGLWLHPVRGEAKCPGVLGEGCCEAGLRFSLCGGQKVDRGIGIAFDGCEIQRVRDPEKLFVELAGCDQCAARFYFGFHLFTELHFLARALLGKRSRDRDFRDFLEKEREKRRGWSFFARRRPEKKVAWSLELTPEQLQHLGLRYGANDLVFKLSGIDQKLGAKIFLWRQSDKIIVSDIDGTITKSDVRGHIYGLVGRDWTHKGVANLYTRIVKNGYKVLYLTTRPLGQSSMTRLYLRSIDQDGERLPEGPTLHSPDGLFAALFREIISRNPQNFKIACLKKIQALFCGEFPFVSGFGNKLTDVITYKAVGIPASKIFTINPQGNIILELTRALTATHHSLNSFVDLMFPNCGSGMAVDFDNRFSDAAFWRVPDNRFGPGSGQ